MQAAHLGHASYPAYRLDRASKRRILLQRKVHASGVIVVDVRRHSATLMRLDEHDQMVEAFPPNGSD